MNECLMGIFPDVRYLLYDVRLFPSTICLQVVIGCFFVLGAFLLVSVIKSVLVGKKGDTNPFDIPSLSLIL